MRGLPTVFLTFPSARHFFLEVRFAKHDSFCEAAACNALSVFIQADHGGSEDSELVRMGFWYAMEVPEISFCKLQIPNR